MSSSTRAVASSASAAERKLVARIAANTRHSRLDAEGRQQATAAARAAKAAKDAERIPADTPPDEREAAIERLRRADMARLTLASLKARSARKAAQEAQEAAQEALDADGGAK